MYYKECPNCGAALDPGERCDCSRGPTSPERDDRDRLVTVPRKFRKEPVKLFAVPAQLHRSGKRGAAW